jgi:hypothetical protein
MKSFLKILISVLWPIIFITSCGKSGVTPQIRPDTASTKTGTTTNTGTVDVYVAGTFSNLNTILHGQACYWKNGTMVLLPSPTSPSQAFSVTVLGSDVYVSGCYGSPETPALWKNGQLIPSSGGSLGGSWGQRATCMTVSNNTLYVGIDTYTYVPTLATTALYLAISGSQSVESALPDAQNQPMIYSMFASGNKVYTAGTGINAFTNQFTATIPVYWVNSNEQALTFPSDFNSFMYRFGEAAGIAVSGTDVYVVGEINGSNEQDGSSPGSAPVIWKNNVATILDKTGPGAWTGGEGTSVAVSNNDVYVAGFLAQINGEEPVLWKNGVMTQLPKRTGDALPSGIAINGSDVYICGIDGVSTNSACYWKNGTETLLTDGTSDCAAHGILVVSH